MNLKIEVSQIQILGFGLMIGAVISLLTMELFSLIVGFALLFVESYWNKRASSKFIN